MNTHRESHLTIQHDNICAKPPLRPILSHLEKLLRDRFVRPLLLRCVIESLDLPVPVFVAMLLVVRAVHNTPNGIFVPLVDGAVLLVQCIVEDHTLDATLAEHRLHERRKAHIAMTQRRRHGSRELQAARLERLHGGEACRERREVPHEDVWGRVY